MPHVFYNAGPLLNSDCGPYHSPSRGSPLSVPITVLAEDSLCPSLSQDPSCWCPSQSSPWAPPAPLPADNSFWKLGGVGGTKDDCVACR